MSTPDPNWQTLNAYVDGELDAANASRVAEAAGRDPGIAQQIAALYRLKGLAHATIPSPSDDLMVVLAQPRRRLGAFAIGALAAAVLLSVGLWFTHASSTTPRLPQAVMQTARDLHDKWLRSGAGPMGNASAATILTALSDFGSMPNIPDLTGTGLTIGFVANAKRGGHRVLQVGYRGHHGCHLSMFVFHDIELAQTPVEVAKGNVLAYGWKAHSLGYLLFAEGMDRGRFDFIGRQVERATRAGRPLDKRDQTRLAENRRESGSCKV